MTDLPLGKTTVSYSGSAVTYTVTVAGRLTAKLWGAGGSGGLEKGTLYGTLPGGAGGFTTIVLDVQIGDTIEVRTAQGGQLGSVTTGTVSGSLTGVGGLGGYPDGGNGGPDPYAMPGGGGGGSRLYLNGTLVAVAGGGGGQGLGVAAQNPGNGGGSSGTAGINTANGGSTGGVTPGSQVAGGVNSARPSDTTTSGSSLRGGHGYVAGKDQNFNYTTNSPNGGGGGGGYYGGGGGGQALSYVNGGSGGSGYINTGHSQYVSGSTTAGASLVPAGTTDVDYPGSSIGYGGASGFAGSAQPGYNGAVILDFPILTAGNYPLAYSGASKTYQAGSNGVLTIKLWGAAGGSNLTADTTLQAGYRGGGGGFTTLQITVNAGDFIRVDVGGGGQRTDVRGGGWPNGGTGGRNSNNDTYNGAGGGGSTAIYLNNTLIAVAGGGGGSQASFIGNGNARGGAGGGDPSGTNASVTTGATNRSGGPGTQSAGGAGGSGSTGRGGSFMQGGNGHDGSVNALLTNAGAGGGGGYYGGGGGAGNSNSSDGPGGSGSGYINSADASYVAASGTTTAGSGVTGAGQGDANYPGSVGSSLANSGGQSGAAWLSFADANVPANTSGDVGTVTISASPAASATGGGGASGSVGTVTLTAPEPTVQVTASVTSDIGTITLTPAEAGYEAEGSADGTLGTITLTPPEALPTTNALVIVPINDDVELPLTAPEGDATGEFTPIEITLPGPLVFHPPLGDGGVPIDVAGDIGTITVDAPLGEAFEAVFGAGDLGTIVLSTPTADAVGYAQAVGATVGEGPNRVLAQIGLGDFRAPAGHVEILGDATGGIDTTLTLTSPQATAQEGVAASGDFATVTLSPPAADAAGAVNAIPPREGALDGPYGVYLKIIFFQAPGAPAVTGAVSATPLISTITTSPPRPTTQLGAQLVLALPRRLEIRAPIGHGALTGEVFAGGDLGTLDLTPPEAQVLIDDSSGDAEAIGDMPILTFTPVEGSVSAPAEATALLPSLYLTAPDAYVETLDDEGHLPATFAPLRFRRTRVVGRAPDSLVEREIALNEADGVLFSRDGDGQVVETPYADLAAGRFAADGGSEGQVLDASGAWIDFEPTYETEIRLPAPAGARIRLSEGLLAEENTSPVKNRVYYRPFFVSQTIDAVDLATEVTTGAPGTAWMGVCAWNLDGSPGDVIVWGSVSTAGAGLARHIEPFRLQTGWYAAMFALSGSGSPVFRASAAPRPVDQDFMPLGDVTAPFAGVLDPAPSPDAQADEAFAYVTLETADG